MPISITDVPPFLTLMQAVAWVATRDPVVVLRASLREIEWKQVCSSLKPETEWCGFMTPGLALFNINLFCQSLDKAEEAVRHLEQALRTGKISASAECFSTGQIERRIGMPALEWAGLQIRESPEKNNELLLYRDIDTIADTDRKKFVEDWRNVRIEFSVLKDFWPINKPDRIALTREPQQHRPGPRPVKTTAITQRMIIDYGGRPEALDHEKDVSLVSAYKDVGGEGEPSRDTVRKARHKALEQLRQNSDRTPIIDN